MNPSLMMKLLSRARAARFTVGLLASIAPSAPGDIYVWGGSIAAGPDGTITKPWTCVKSAVLRINSGGTIRISGGAYGGGHDRNLRITTPMRLTTYAATTNAAGIPASIGKRAAFSESEKLAMLRRYAPYIFFSYDLDDTPELFWPSSVEWAFNMYTPPPLRNGLRRFPNPDDGGNYWLETQFDVEPASNYNFPLFYGNLDSARVYAFWAEKTSSSAELTPVFDLVYFLYFPYNRGKYVVAIDSVMGSHVGDWEHVSVRTFGGVAGAVYAEAHGSGGARGWNEYAKYPGYDYPIVYCAWGSHGFYHDPGVNVYQPIAGLYDSCLPYRGWASGYPVSRLEAFDFTAQPKARLGDPRPYPRWLDTDYTSAGDGDPSIPGGGPIAHWGNRAKGSGRLDDGPTGPADKGALKTQDIFE